MRAGTAGTAATVDAYAKRVAHAWHVYYQLLQRGTVSDTAYKQYERALYAYYAVAGKAEK